MKHANTANWTISKLPKYRGHWGARNIFPEGLFEAFESQMERRRRRAGGRRVRAHTIAISSSNTPPPSDRPRFDFFLKKITLAYISAHKRGALFLSGINPPPLYSSQIS